MNTEEEVIQPYQSDTYAKLTRNAHNESCNTKYRENR